MSAITTDTFPTQCTVCQGPVTDNRPKKASSEYKSNYPDWKCQNESCMTNGYRTGGYVKADASAPVAPPARMASDDPWKTMEARYGRCQHIAARLTKGYLDPKIDKVEFGAVVHHLSITANQNNFPLIAKPAPTPPEPTPRDIEDEYAPGPEDGGDSGLPF